MSKILWPFEQFDSFYFCPCNFRLLLEFFHEIRKSRHFRGETDAEKFLLLVADGCHFHLDAGKNKNVAICCSWLIKFVDITNFNQDSNIFFMSHNGKYLIPYFVGQKWHNFFQLAVKIFIFILTYLKILFCATLKRKEKKKLFFYEN